MLSHCESIREIQRKPLNAGLAVIAALFCILVSHTFALGEDNSTQKDSGKWVEIKGIGGKKQGGERERLADASTRLISKLEIELEDWSGVKAADLTELKETSLNYILALRDFEFSQLDDYLEKSSYSDVLADAQDTIGSWLNAAGESYSEFDSTRAVEIERALRKMVFGEALDQQSAKKLVDMLKELSSELELAGRAQISRKP